MALYLDSDESRFVSGANIVIEGGAVIEPGVSSAPMIRAAQNAGLVGRDFGSTGKAPIYQQQDTPGKSA